MRFVHAADLHLDSPLRNLALQDEAQARHLRRACRDAFESLIDLCIERQAAFLIIAGDLYDHDSPNMQVAVFLRNQLARLDRAGIRVVVKKGNHDAASRITSDLGLPANTSMFGDRKPETIVFDDLRVALHGQSFRPGPVTENMALGYGATVPGYLNIGVLHTSLAGSSEHDVYAPCRLEELTTRGYAYWALGHIHKGEVLAEDPWVVYPGNIQGRHARETGPKGCLVVDTDGDRVTAAEFVPLDVVRWHQVAVDLEGAGREPEAVERIRAGLAQASRDADGRPSAIRLTLSGRTPLQPALARRPERLRQTVLELAGEIGDGLWIEKIQDRTVGLDRPRNGGGNDSAAELIRIMQEVFTDPLRIQAILKQELEPLRAKLPEDLKELPAFALLEDAGLARDALARLEPSMAARLAGEDD
jgi:DNA repair exonuclease SbcCD nuclease subunit